MNMWVRCDTGDHPICLFFDEAGRITYANTGNRAAQYDTHVDPEHVRCLDCGSPIAEASRGTFELRICDEGHPAFVRTDGEAGSEVVQDGIVWMVDDWRETFCPLCGADLHQGQM